MVPVALVRGSPVSLATNPRNGEAGDGPQLMMWVLDPVVTRQQLTVKGGWHIRPEGPAWRWGYLSSMCQLRHSEVLGISQITSCDHTGTGLLMEG